MWMIFVLWSWIVDASEIKVKQVTSSPSTSAKKEMPEGEGKLAKEGPTSPPRVEVVRKAGRSSAKTSSTRTTSQIQATPFLSDEAVNLIVPNQKYVLKYEDEDSLGKIQNQTSPSITATFSLAEVEEYQNAVKNILYYRAQAKSRCLGESSKKLNESLEKYLVSLSYFNRKALPMVADISENNNQLVLVINRTTLIDAPVLTSRYFQFKKQRFKESMQKFLNADAQLINSMVKIASTFRVDLNEDLWNRTYGLRENALEMISQWPRELIFSATEKLSSAKETACSLDPQKPDTVRLAE